jgi:TolB-like protein/DNA-binding winged helix-turn-helix (wHTH) protein/Tfp pilus assembly protein PilF
MKSFLSFRLDAANHSLWRGEERLQITPKAFDVLRYMVENAGRVVTQDELLEALWTETYVNPEILRKYILEIRRVLGDEPRKPQYIETITKRGYRFVAPVIDENAGEPAGTLSSSATQELAGAERAVARQQSFPGTDRRRKLMGLTLLLLAAAAAVAEYFWFARSRANVSSSKDASIAVLPFIDLSPGKDQEYFSDGLTEELINDLAQVSGLKVVARSSAFQFKGKNEDLRAVGQKLGVANILEGSVRREGNRVRITAELIKADDGFQIWSSMYDREMSNILAAQDEIARAVSVALRFKLLSASGATIPASSRATNPEAYQAYLQGQYFMARGQAKEDLDKALSYADQAIKLDPSYAAAWAQRSQLLEKLAGIALIENTEGFRRARESAEKAIALDPNLAAGYLALALVQIDHDWDWELAGASLKRAGQLEPGSAAVLGMQAYLTRKQGRLEEAIGLYRQAIALDPLRANFQLALGDKLYDLGRYEEAKAALDKAQELNSQLASLHLTRGELLLSEGHAEEAAAEIEKEAGEWQRLTGQALAYSAGGRRQEGDSALKKLIAAHQNDSAYQIAEIYAYRGETEKAFQWLDRAILQRDPGAPESKTDPLMRSLRRDPRYAELLNKMRLPTS